MDPALDRPGNESLRGLRLERPKGLGAQSLANDGLMG